MYVSSINPSQVVATSQGFQTGATAFPVAIRPGIQGNTVTYTFNPLLSQSSMWGINPAFSSASVNPLLNQSLAWTWNPLLAGTGISATNPIMANAGISAWNPAMSTALAQNMITGSGLSAWNPVLNSVQAMNTAIGSSPMAINTIQATSGMAQMRVDIHETNSDVVVAAELPNVSLNDLNLTVTDDSLSISATAFAGSRTTSLFRSVALPTSIKSEQVEATYTNGILEIRAPKSDVVTRRKVKVNIS